MRLNNETVRSVGLGGVLTTSEFNISDGSKLIEMILDNAYSDPYRATVREICQNASEVDPAFRIHLPTPFEPWFAVIDDGGGMSREDTIRHASGIGSSTKDGDNTKVGGFGIGMKVPFTVSDQYTVISRHGGMSRTFSAYKDDHNRARFTMLSEVADDGPAGLEVRVPVRPENFRRIKDAVVSELRWFDPKPAANLISNMRTPTFSCTSRLLDLAVALQIDLSPRLLDAVEPAVSRLGRKSGRAQVNQQSGNRCLASMSRR